MRQSKAYLLFVLITASLCSVPAISSADSDAAKYSELPTAIDALIDETVKTSNPTIGMANSIIEIDVYITAEPDLEGLGGTLEDVRNNLFLMIIPSAIGGALAVPRIAAYAASGSASVAGEEHIKRGRPAAVGKVMDKIDFAAEIKSSLSGFLKPAKAAGKTGSENYRLELLIESYGFVAKPESEHACFYVETMMNLHLKDRIIQQETISLSPLNRSEGAPPPYCARQKDFVKNNGALVKLTLKETAIILSAIIASRLGVLP